MPMVEMRIAAAYGIFAGSKPLTFLVTGLVAFLLGVAVTVFCIRWKRWQDEKKETDEP